MKIRKNYFASFWKNLTKRISFPPRTLQYTFMKFFQSFPRFSNILKDSFISGTNKTENKK